MCKPLMAAKLPWPPPPPPSTTLLPLVGGCDGSAVMMARLTSCLSEKSYRKHFDDYRDIERESGDGGGGGKCTKSPGAESV